jgi:2-polyprenyl-3-methyl-5-hydroxy-6-metoxy-1,4-benzoquinol methylase
LLFRIHLAKFFIKLGRFFQELPVFIMRPEDLIRFGRVSYSNPASTTFWTSEDLIDSGLWPGELELFEALPARNGNLLLLGMGGGREAIFLAKAGFNVTGVDFIEEMVEKAKGNARQRGVEIQGKVQEMSQLDFDSGTYDVIWFSCSIYSTIPGKKARIEMLQRVGKWIKPRGRVVCGFYWNPAVKHGKLMQRAGKIFSWITFGNTQYEQGDILKDSSEFVHAFRRKRDLKEEFDQAGFEVIQFSFPDNSNNAGALLRKKR